MHPTLAADLCQLNFAEGAEGTGNQDILNLWTGKNLSCPRRQAQLCNPFLSIALLGKPSVQEHSFLGKHRKALPLGPSHIVICCTHMAGGHT
eukprot:1144778-Pelagomonas_calceolata.AAC.3